MGLTVIRSQLCYGMAGVLVRPRLRGCYLSLFFHHFNINMLFLDK